MSAAALKRGVLGGFAGAIIFAVIVELVRVAALFTPLVFWIGLWSFLGAGVIGGTAGAVFGMFAGAWQIRGWAKDAVIGILAGCFLGLLAAVLVSDASFRHIFHTSDIGGFLRAIICANARRPLPGRDIRLHSRRRKMGCEAAEKPLQRPRPLLKTF